MRGQWEISALRGQTRYGLGGIARILTAGIRAGYFDHERLRGENLVRANLTIGTGPQHASGFHDGVEAELREILIGETDVIEREIGLRQIQSEAQLVGIIVGENEQRQMLHHGLQRHDDAALFAGPAASNLRDCGRITLHGRAGHGDGRGLGRTLRTGDKPRVLRGGVPAILAEADLVVVGGMADILPIHDGTAASGGNSATIQQERGTLVGRAVFAGAVNNVPRDA